MSSADLGTAACTRQNLPRRDRATHATPCPAVSSYAALSIAIREVSTSPSHGSSPSPSPPRLSPGPSPSSNTGWTSTRASFGSPGTVTWVTRGSHGHRRGALAPKPLPSPETANGDPSRPLRWTDPVGTPAFAAWGPPGTSTSSCQPSPRMTSAKASSDAATAPSPPAVEEYTVHDRQSEASVAPEARATAAALLHALRSSVAFASPSLE